MADFQVVDDYPTSSETYTDTSYYPAEPQERIEEESYEAAVLSTSYPIIPEIAQWFDDQIKGCDSRSYIKAYAVAHNIEHTAELDKAFDIVKELLEIKSSEFIHMKDAA